MLPTLLWLDRVVPVRKQQMAPGIVASFPYLLLSTLHRDAILYSTLNEKYTGG